MSKSGIGRSIRGDGREPGSGRRSTVRASRSNARSASDVRTTHRPWSRIVSRYDELLVLDPTPVVALNRAVAVAEADGPQAALAALEGIDARDLPGHRLPAVRAELLARAGLHAEARAAYDEAVARCANEAERAHLEERRAALPG